jgi:hypothetical protein
MNRFLSFDPRLGEFHHRKLNFNLYYKNLLTTNEL